MNWRVLGKVTWLPPIFRLRILPPKPARFPKNSKAPDQKSPLRWGENGLGHHLESPSPLQGILLFASFSLVIGDLGCFINAKCPSWCSPSFWSSRSHPGMATFCCSAQKAASAAQFGRLREFEGDMSPEQQNTDHHAKHHTKLFLCSNSLL